MSDGTPVPRYPGNEIGADLSVVDMPLMIATRSEHYSVKAPYPQKL
jgi:hypothetical protein